MNILGLHFGHDASAVIVKDGKLVTAISGERISRIKKTDRLTQDIVEIALKEANLTIDDIDQIGLSDYFYYDDDTFLILKDNETDNIIYSTSQKIFGNDIVEVKSFVMGKEIKTFVIPHHMSHCASAYYTSNFEESWCFSMDASAGDIRSNSLIAKGSGNKLYALYCPGLMTGVAYGSFTEFLKIGPALHKAGSTMGLSSYGKVKQLVLDKINQYVSSMSFSSDIGTAYYNVFHGLWNQLSERKDIKSDSVEGMDIAATIQFIFENSVLNTIKDINKEGVENLCLSGGSMLNCNTNSLIKKDSGFKNIHLFPACGDDGIAVGAALYVAHHINDEPRTIYEPQDICYLGVKQEYIEPNYSEIAKVIADGGIVAWFMGRSEYGPRALGNRSLLADPRNFHNREILNFVIKNREWYRPFAPVVLEEKSSEWFDFEGPSPFMLFTADVKNPHLIPAVTHVDNSARHQTINEKTNPPYYRVVKAFEEITGVPMLINTSLNGSGEPILETEEDAMNFFKKNTGVSLLVLNGKLVYRKDLV